MPVDGFAVAYKWDNSNSTHNATVRLDGFAWEAPKGMYVESIRKYKGYFYIVLRGACKDVSPFAHGVCCVSREKSVVLEKLSELVVFGDAAANAVPYLSMTDYTSTFSRTVWYRCIPSTMMLPSVRNISNVRRKQDE